MNKLSARTAAIRMAILFVSVGAIDAAIVAIAKHPLPYAGWIPALIPLLAPLTIWEVFRDSGKSGID